MQAARTLSRQLEAAPRCCFRAVPTSVGHQNRRGGADGPELRHAARTGGGTRRMATPAATTPTLIGKIAVAPIMGDTSRDEAPRCPPAGPAAAPLVFAAPASAPLCRLCERPCRTVRPGTGGSSAELWSCPRRSESASFERSALYQSVWDGLDAAPSRPHLQRRRQPLTWSHPVARPRRWHPELPGAVRPCAPRRTSRAEPALGALLLGRRLAALRLLLGARSGAPPGDDGRMSAQLEPIGVVEVCRLSHERFDVEELLTSSSVTNVSAQPTSRRDRSCRYGECSRSARSARENSPRSERR